MSNSEAFYQFTPEKNLLAGKIIVVSGATSGIGRCAAKTFAAHGATVVLLGRTMGKLESIYDEIDSQGLPQPAIFPINFESAVAQDYEQLKAALTDEFGRIDGLLNNAGILGSRTPVDFYASEEWSKVIQLNLNAPFLLTKSLLPLLRKSANGRILFTSSGVAEKGRAFWGAYAASKAGVVNLMETLADELEESPIKVNAINPGATRTAMRAAAYPAENPMTIAPPDQLMNQYLYLISTNCDLHGQNLDAQH